MNFEQIKNQEDKTSLLEKIKNASASTKALVFFYFLSAAGIGGKLTADNWENLSYKNLEKEEEKNNVENIITADSVNQKTLVNADIYLPDNVDCIEAENLRTPADGENEKKIIKRNEDGSFSIDTYGAKNVAHLRDGKVVGIEY